MINFEKMIQAVDDTLYVIYDEDLMPVYPTNKMALDKISNFLDDIIKNGSNFYHTKTNTYWEKKIFPTTFHNKHYFIERYQDITRFKEREKDLSIDPITHLFTRSVAMDRMKKILCEMLRKKEPFAFVIGDIDLFKKVNDTYGHSCGDMVLETVGTVLKNNTKQLNRKNKDVIGRFGGEEFAILLQNISCEDTYKRIEDLRKLVSSSTIFYDDEEVHVTISFGFIHSDMLEMDDSCGVDCIFEQIYSMADKALYYAKETTRNRVVRYTDLPKNYVISNEKR